MSMKMQGFDPDRLQPAENYKLLAGSVVPRPIAFVSTVDQAGLRNVAPYSFFTVASANPPVVCFCPAVRPASNGLAAHKDTLANVRATGEFVVNIVSMDFVEKMNAAAAQVAPGVDEFALAGLTPAPSEVVRAPGVSESRVRMECRLLQVVDCARPRGALPRRGGGAAGENAHRSAESGRGRAHGRLDLHPDPRSLRSGAARLALSAVGSG
jgi:flavin reductase (DIM6/NTAB) family NADH-FMN oxidoreductase RutF